MNGLEKFILISLYLNNGKICYPKLRNLVLVGIGDGVLTDVGVSEPDLRNTYLPIPSIFSALKSLEKKEYINIYGSDITDKVVSLTEKGLKKAKKIVDSDDKWVREAVSVVEVWKNAHPYTVLYYVFTKFRDLYPRDRAPIIMYRVPDQCLMR